MGLAQKAGVGFPRVCGDVPLMAKSIFNLAQFSPRMRGCSCGWDDLQQAQAVFPAYAGMFRSRSFTSVSSPSFPRVCGDVPRLLLTFLGQKRFSPRMRGCSSETPPVFFG